MKKLIVSALALIAAVLPMAEAAPKPKAPKIFGDFTPGKTFTFTVTTAQTSATQGTTVLPTAPVPKGVPAYTVGQQVTFKIGKKGELTGPGFKLGFLSGSVGANAYFNKPKKNTSPSTGAVHKNTTTNEPTAVSLSFFTFKLTKRIPYVTQTTYILQ
ncbi:hypothetical protein OKA04_15615 [Luteolibacter flavescens]|uniref:Uncharacterized protein n=1 Tax=Luteolibacter flavescens TaxID=1859460 RepID=A0ABT3FT51_9BACT|nr:hypothetical protein [Luteolibacter flavescens]MCW1886165.1 hypothetical protein [Luteolibacter flavescens]